MEGVTVGSQEDYHTKISFLEAFPLMAKAGDTVLLQGCGSCGLCEGTAVPLETHLWSPAHDALPPAKYSPAITSLQA